MQRKKDNYYRLLKLVIPLTLAPCLPLGAQLVTASHQYAANRAAVVMVKTEVSATVYVRQITINNSAFNRLLDSIQRLEQDSVAYPASQKLDIVLKEFNTKAPLYFRSNFNFFRHKQKVTANGTGFIFDRNGYLFTNCHVVDEDAAYIRRKFILSAFTSVTETNIRAIESAWAVKFTEQQRNLLYRTFSDVYSGIMPMQTEDLKKEIFVLLNMEKSNGEKIVQRLPAVIITKGRAMPGKDVAILKVNAGKELPTIKMASVVSELVGEDVFVYGFPDPVNRNEFLSDETVLEPTLTKGIISARKKTTDGWPVIQMDANIHYGNSGGPVCNKTGEVIGITTFGSVDDQGRALASGMNFAIPVAILNEFLEKQSMTPVTSAVSERFGEAIGYYEKAQYRKALGLFEKIREIDSLYPGLHSYIAQSNAFIKRGEDRTPIWPQFVWPIAAIFIFGGYYMLTKKKRQVEKPGKRKVALNPEEN